MYSTLMWRSTCVFRPPALSSTRNELLHRDIARTRPLRYRDQTISTEKLWRCLEPHHTDVTILPEGGENTYVRNETRCTSRVSTAPNNQVPRMQSQGSYMRSNSVSSGNVEEFVDIRALITNTTFHLFSLWPNRRQTYALLSFCESSTILCISHGPSFKQYRKRIRPSTESTLTHAQCRFHSPFSNRRTPSILFYAFIRSHNHLPNNLL